MDLHSKGNMAINGGHDDPFSYISGLLCDTGVDSKEVAGELKAAIATSSALSYINVGRPETIFLDTEDRLKERLVRETGHPSQSQSESE